MLGTIMIETGQKFDLACSPKGILPTPVLIISASDIVVHVLSRERTSFPSDSPTHRDTFRLMVDPSISL